MGAGLNRCSCVFFLNGKQDLEMNRVSESKYYEKPCIRFIPWEFSFHLSPLFFGFFFLFCILCFSLTVSRGGFAVIAQCWTFPIPPFASFCLFRAFDFSVNV